MAKPMYRTNDIATKPTLQSIAQERLKAFDYGEGGYQSPEKELEMMRNERMRTVPVGSFPISASENVAKSIGGIPKMNENSQYRSYDEEMEEKK